jgi:hypothetical protein
MCCDYRVMTETGSIGELLAVPHLASSLRAFLFVSTNHSLNVLLHQPWRVRREPFRYLLLPIACRLE